MLLVRHLSLNESKRRCARWSSSTRLASTKKPTPFRSGFVKPPRTTRKLPSRFSRFCGTNATKRMPSRQVPHAHQIAQPSRGPRSHPNRRKRRNLPQRRS